LKQVVLDVERMSFISIESFADESYQGHSNESPWYVVAGYYGSPGRWRRFERLWAKAKAEERIRTIGFHANKCVRGRGQYQDIPEDRRERVQRKLIAAIRASKVTGIVASIEMAVYRSIRDRLSAHMKEPIRKFNNPYCLSFHQYIQLVCKVDKSNKRIRFVFHRRPKGQLGSAPEWYDGLQEHKLIPWSGRIGPFAWDEPSHAVALDAADMLAYCGYRHLSGDHTPWQWDALNAAGLIVPFSFNEKFWNDAMRKIDRMPDVTTWSELEALGRSV
jgi:hypothetical protein